MLAWITKVYLTSNEAKHNTDHLHNLSHTHRGKCCPNVLNSFSGVTRTNPTIFLPLFLAHNEGLNPGVICWSLTSGQLFAGSATASLSLNKTTMPTSDKT